MTEIDQEEYDAPVNETPGSLLKAARETAGMSLEQAAEKLHLLREMVVALEEEDASKLPSRVFTLGYLKNYARILEVPESSIMALVGDGVGEVGEIRSLQQPHAPQIRSRTRIRQPGDGGGNLLKALPWLIGISILALLILWWRGAITLPEMNDWSFPSFSGEQESVEKRIEEGHGEDSETLTLSIGDAPAVQDDPETAMDAEVEEQAEAVPAPQPVDENRIDLSLDTVVSGESYGDEPGTTQAIEASAADLAAADPATAEETAEETAVEAVDTAVSEPGAAVEEPLGSEQKFTLDFDAVSWVNVSDADQKNVLFGDMAAGSSKILDGRAPFTFVLGNAAHVKLTVDGRPYDMAPHIRGGVARFVLGEPAAAGAE